MAFSDSAGARAIGRAVNPVKFPGRTVRGWQEAAAILRLAGVVACMGTGGGVQVSDHFRAILGCLLSETWTTPTLVELVSTPDGHLLGRCAGEAASRVFPGGNSTFIAARISRFEVTRVAVPRR